MKKSMLFFIFIFTIISVKSQNTNFHYSEKDYLITMNKVVNTIEDLYNSNGNDTTLTTKLMDLSSDSVYVLSGGMDQRYPVNYSIKEWFVPTINRLYTYSPTTLEVMEKVKSWEQITKKGERIISGWKKISSKYIGNHTKMYRFVLEVGQRFL